MSKKSIKKQSANFAIVSVAAVAATALTFLFVGLLAPAESYVRALFFERSWIQYVTTFCFWVIMVTLFFKQLWFRHEMKAFEESKKVIQELGSGSTLIWADAPRIRQSFVAEDQEVYKNSTTFERILNALDRLRKTQSTRAFEEYFRTRSDIDSGELESSYAGIRYFIWLIPTLGFIGTVMGIGFGIKGFSDIIANAQNFKVIQEYLPTVTSYLGTAFDTTLLALGLSTLAVFYMSFLLKREEQLLEEIDNLCFDGVCPLFQEHSGASDDIIEAFNDNVEQIRKSMSGNRAAIESVIRQEFPALLADELTPQFKNLATHLEKIAKFSEQLINQKPQPQRKIKSVKDDKPADGQLKNETLQNTAGILELTKVLQDVTKTLDKNNTLFEGLAENLQKLQADTKSKKK